MFWNFNFSISPSNEYSGLISCRSDWFNLLAVQSLLQHHNSKASVHQHSDFFKVQLSHPYRTTGKSMKVQVSQLCLTLCDPMDCSPPASSIHGIFPDKNTGVGWHFLIQGIFLTQGSNQCLSHCRQALYHLSYQGIPTGKSIALTTQTFVAKGLYSPWSPGQNTGVCSLSLLQGIFPTQGSNSGLLYCRWILYQLSFRETQIPI